MRRRVHNKDVFICLYMLPGSLFSKSNLIICCGDTGDFELFAGKRQDCNNPQLPPLHKNHPLDLKSKQPKWLDEIRATLLAVKLNRICAC